MSLCCKSLGVGQLVPTSALQTAGWRVMKRILEFLCVPVLDGAGVGVGNLNVRLRFEVKIYFWKLQF